MLQVVDALRPITDKPLDCHLMIVEPELRVADFAKARQGRDRSGENNSRSTVLLNCVRGHRARS